MLIKLHRYCTFKTVCQQKEAYELGLQKVSLKGSKDFVYKYNDGIGEEIKVPQNVS